MRSGIASNSSAMPLPSGMRTTLPFTFRGQGNGRTRSVVCSLPLACPLAWSRCGAEGYSPAARTSTRLTAEGPHPYVVEARVEAGAAHRDQPDAGACADGVVDPDPTADPAPTVLRGVRRVVLAAFHDPQPGVVGGRPDHGVPVARVR